MTTLASTLVDWNALGKVVLYSLAAGIGVPAIFAFAVLGTARSADASRDRRGGVATIYAVLAIVGALVCLATVAYGIYLMTQKG